ncbi:MAG: hypothetical protein HZB26_18970 [Candidatus Hydrogenedentes bacterium]|nr:hypothetical protein [Candidatus Hydrogenedentota bacterium]
MADVNTSDPKQQRNFGLVMAAALAALCAWGWWRHDVIHVWMLAIAGAFFLLAFVAPALLRPVLVVWLKFSEALNWVVTRVLLTISFWCMIVPARYILRLRGEDPLQRQWAPERTSYWEEPDAQPADLDAYKNQF